MLSFGASKPRVKGDAGPPPPPPWILTCPGFELVSPLDIAARIIKYVIYVNQFNRELRLKFQRKMLIITLMSLTLVITNWQYW